MPKHTGLFNGLLDTESLCPTTGKPHRLEIEIGEGEDLTSMKGKFPFKCSCGLELAAENSQCWTSHHSAKYRNPQTGEVSHSIYKVKTPGAMWYCPWFIEDNDGQPEVISGRLSRFYLEHWLGKRPL